MERENEERKGREEREDEEDGSKDGTKKKFSKDQERMVGWKSGKI